MTNYQIHPEAERFPMIEGFAYEAFKEDIRVNGQLEPIRLLDGKIIDGRNRYKALTELGMPLVTEDVEGDADSLVMSFNLHRRHLSKSQRDALIESKRAEGKSTRQIAEEVGCSNATVARTLEATVTNVTVEPATIVGKDGKKRLASAPKKERRTAESIKVDEEIKARLAEGKKPQQIGVEIGKGTFTVERRIANMTIDELERENELLKATAITSNQLEEFLSLPEKQKIDRAIAIFEKKKLAEMREEFTAELAQARKKLNEEIARLSAERKQVEETRKKLQIGLSTIDRMMTYEEFKIVRGCLHPDRQPEEFKDRFGKAFDIFTRLEKAVNPTLNAWNEKKRA